MSVMLICVILIFFNPTPLIFALARATSLLERSTPVNALSGNSEAMPIRLLPLPQPSSSTRQQLIGGGVMPNKMAVLESLLGWVSGYGYELYGTSSYESATLS